MAYQIDFTASNYVLRSRRKVALRLLLLAAVAAVAGVVHDCYVTYNRPTLNMRLADYEAASRPIEDINAKWDEAAREYNAMVRYYRLLWAGSVTNFLSAMASERAPRLGPGFNPSSWSLVTGGGCSLTYSYKFGVGDKAEQAKGLENRVVGLVTSVVEVVGGRVDVQGVQHENLLNVDGFNVAARFSLANASNFPGKVECLAGCVEEIASMRKKVQELMIRNTSGNKGASAMVRVDELLRQYLPIGKDKPGFPNPKSVIDVDGWFRDRADPFVAQNNIPPGDLDRKTIRAMWNTVGDARLPWSFWFWNARYRALDNEELVLATKVLKDVADGASRFKPFLEKRHADCLKKLEPFVHSYSHSDVGNNPFIETDLKERVARNAGIFHASVAFKDEPAAEPAVLEREDEKFTFTWVRWTLSLGSGVGREGSRERQSGENAESLTLAKVDDCARRILALGPGYAIEKLRVDFMSDGTVAGAVFEGLLPVKKSSKKEAGNVH